MLIGVYVKNPQLRGNSRFTDLRNTLVAGNCRLYDVETTEDLLPGTDVLLSVGGDGTFLSAAKRVGASGIPVLGVNMGRLGFLSEYVPEEVAEPLLSGDFVIEDRSLLDCRPEDSGIRTPEGFWPYALNEVTVHRIGSSVLGISVWTDGDCLPTYWADGLVVATSSGSTAYSLSVGGPICTPGSKVLVISPIAPHNLNVRPLIVPDTTSIKISALSRDGEVNVTMDNRSLKVPDGSVLDISMAHFSLKRVRLSRSNFIGALKGKLFWGEDVRNGV